MDTTRRKETVKMTEFIGFNYCVSYENGHLTVVRVDEVNNDREVFLSSDSFCEKDFYEICELLRKLSDRGCLL